MYNAWPIRPWSEHDPTMNPSVRNPPRNGGYFSCLPGVFCVEKYNISRSDYHAKFHQVLRLPRKVALELVLRLPRKVASELHQVLRLPRKVTLELDHVLVLRLPRKVTLLTLTWLYYYLAYYSLTLLLLNSTTWLYYYLTLLFLTLLLLDSTITWIYYYLPLLILDSTVTCLNYYLTYYLTLLLLYSAMSFVCRKFLNLNFLR